MSYVTSVLQPGETVLHTASLHWVLYLRGLMLWVLALIVYIYGMKLALNSIAVDVVTGALLIAGLFLVATAWFHQWITEIAVTNRRVIYKTGLISRRTSEMNMDKVESVVVDQTIMGRLLDYGSIDIRGTGEGLETLRKVASPLALRNAITAH
jgi:uncharacterized membrane protein YdbT with pleckstrin-like domain